MKALGLILLNCLLVFNSLAQTTSDSLWAVWKDEAKPDSVRMEALYICSWEFLYSNPDSMIVLTNLLENFSVKNKKVSYQVDSYDSRASAYSVKGKQDSALKYYKKALQIAKENDLKNAIAQTNSGLGLFYCNKKEYDKSIAYYTDALKTAISNEDTVFLVRLYGNIGLVYEWQDNLQVALEYYFKSLRLYEELSPSKKRSSRALLTISRIYKDVGDLEKAFLYNEKALNNGIEYQDWYMVLICYFDKGLMYEDQEKNVEALEQYLKALVYAMKHGDTHEISFLYYNIVNVCLELGSLNMNQLKVGNIVPLENLELSKTSLEVIQKYSLQELLEKSIDYSQESGNMIDLTNSFLVMGKLKKSQGKNHEAIKYMTKAYDAAQKIESLGDKMERGVDVVEELYHLYKEQGKYKQSIAMLEEYILLKDSLHIEEAKRELYSQEYKYNYEKKVAIDSIKHKKAQKIKQVEIEKQKVEIKNQKNRQLLLYGGLGIALLFSIYFVKKNKEVREQKIEVEKQKDFAEEQQEIAEQQKEILGKQHREIRDSINYAQNLQRSVLPSKEDVSQNFPNSFVLLKPKDVVSGDFYWTYKKGKLAYLAVVDCTGHGVPGAFMTIVANNLLNEIIQGDYNTPKEIIEELHQRIKLRIGGSPAAQVRDSMDLGLFSYNEQTREVRFVGTHTSIYCVRNSSLEKFKGSKADIGYKPNLVVEEQVFQVETNDMLYMHSDGYPDQKGGPRGKKFYYLPIRKKLEEISLLNLMEQEQIMNQTFEEWKGDLEQFDDVCMLGVRIV